MSIPDETSPAPTTVGAAAPPIDRADVCDLLGLLRWLLSTKGPIKPLEEHAKQQLLAVRANGRPVMGEDEREAVYVAGQRFGTMHMPKRRLRITITDDDAYAAWAKSEGYGTEVETVERVRGSFHSKLKKAADTSGAARKHLQMVHPRTGELIDIPGVTVTLDAAAPTFEAAEDATQVLREAWHSGALQAVLADILTAPAPQLEEGTGQ
ncbi:hypothetical protein ACGFJC_47235 [Nonomuraea fuscirosea]|uniref:hypothetical protein n=1 Tax=Nonomuraea fuscirosea TaxID=1291556 RepID=UPI0037220A77